MAEKLPEARLADPAGLSAAMVEALRESRHRWRELVLLTADLAFETDSEGRFTLLEPDTVLGWQADQLLGQPADMLLAKDDRCAVFNPFRPEAPVKGRRAWLKRADGSVACLSFSTAPMPDVAGRRGAARGVAQDVTEQDDGDGTLAAALRRSEVVDFILSQMRQEVMAPRMMQAVLEALGGALGAEGAAVLDMLGGGDPLHTRHQIGREMPSAADSVVGMLASGGATPAIGFSEDGRALLVSACETRFGQRAALLLWRAAGARGWDDEDRTIVASVSGLVRVIMEHDAIQQEMARQARTDPLTGLLNRRAFLEEVARRIDRLDREGIPATLMFVDVDHFKRINDTLGHESGDEALCTLATLLRATVRPSDLVARLGGDEFALWLDGMEELTASERAEMLRVEGPAATSHLTARAVEKGAAPIPPLTLSTGIATRWPGRGEDVEALIHRADQIMYEVKRAGRAHWRVSRAGAW